jgi:tRNA threonylcarbamoyladenosine biosynthesis protein TsaB
MDAGRDELFVGVYFISPDRQGPTRIDESLRSRDEVNQELREQAQSAVITCDDAVAALLAETGFAVQQVARPDSERIAQLGLKKLLRGEIVTPEALDANYLRRSDAEIFFRESKV